MGVSIQVLRASRIPMPRNPNGRRSFCVRGQTGRFATGRKMKAKGVIYILAAAVIAALVVANWTLLIGPVELNLLIARVQAPLALLLLLFAGIILLLDLSVHALREYAWIRERRTLARELEIARLRAEKEEESRTSALKATVQSELAAIRAQLDRVLAMQAAGLEHTTTARSPEAIEPELIPPRGRGAY
jgi:uncharacterized integral membrane protein